MSERKLATIRKIAEIKPIEGADRIVAYRVDGWWVVDSVGKFNQDELVVYMEPDSWVPTAIAPFLTKPGHFPKTFEGVEGERLKTIRLKGQLSQGLLLKTDSFSGNRAIVSNAEGVGMCFEVDDPDCILTEHLGILKYEKPLPAQLAGMARGNFPSFIPKTDQERIQNCTRSFEKWKTEEILWEISEKLDGSSMTVYCKIDIEDGLVLTTSSGVCSRNLDLKFDENNSFWQAEQKYDLIKKIMSTGRNLAIQGELIGEGIQGNNYKLTGREFYCFDIYDIDKREYLLPMERIVLCKQLGIQHVPIVDLNSKIAPDETIADLLKLAEGKSEVGAKPEREGWVFKSMTEHDVSFKAISNRWLEKYE
jgi:RNA ligase (TIGR02306 family)